MVIITSDSSIYGRSGFSTVQIKGVHKELRLMNMVNYRYQSKTLAKITVHSLFEATCDPNRMKDLQESEGFIINNIYGDYHFSPYEGGELCVIVAEKN